MPFNGSGVYTPPAADFPVVTNTVISSTHFNNTINDIATGLTNCLTKDGQSTPIANIKMGGFKITGLGAPTLAGDALSEGAAIGATSASTLRGTSLTLTTAVSKIVPGATSLSLRNSADNADNLIITDAGAATVRTTLTATTSVVTPIVDSGTGSLSIRSDGTTEMARFFRVASAINFFAMNPNTAGLPVQVGAVGGDANVAMNWYSAGTGAHVFQTGGGSRTQFQILDTASVNRNITVTGSNGGNPTISTTAGSLAIAPNVVLTGILQSGTTPAQGGQLNIPYGGLVSSRNQSGGADITLISSATINGVTNTIGVGAGTSTGVLLDARSGAGAPTTSDLGASRWMLWRDTTGATTKLYYNNAGTLQSVALV